jgi:chemotaxis protein methyltransferase CheR
MSMMANEVENLEIDLLLEAIKRRYGYDFHNYVRSSLKRRILHRMAIANLSRISDMLSCVIHDKSFFDDFLKDMSITVTEMFRDASFYIALREQVIPLLKTYSFVKIWHAGCATGEEVYSMAVMLKEADFNERVQIYATDYNKRSLSIAKDGLYPLKLVRGYEENYRKAGGEHSLSDYYHTRYKSVMFDAELSKNITFAHHNLVTDGVFGEMNLIICRNVLIYFNRALQNQVLQLFMDSLCRGGLLCLGNKESLDYADVVGHFGVLSKANRIYKKLGSPYLFTQQLTEG